MSGEPLLFSQTLWFAVARGLQVTVLLTVLSMGLGLALGTCVALARMYGGPITRAGALGYVFLFRGLPLLILLYFLYYGVPQVPGIRTSVVWILLSSAFATCVIAFTLNNAAYLAEAIRGGMQTVKKGEIEAGHALGLSPVGVVTRIVLPLGFRNCLAQMGNETIFSIKASAVASVVTVRDLVGQAQYVGNIYSDNVTPLLAAAAAYIVLVQIVEWGVRALRRAWHPRRAAAPSPSVPTLQQA